MRGRARIHTLILFGSFEIKFGKIRSQFFICLINEKPKQCLTELPHFSMLIRPMPRAFDCISFVVWPRWLVECGSFYLVFALRWRDRRVCIWVNKKREIVWQNTAKCIAFCAVSLSSWRQRQIDSNKKKESTSFTVNFIFAAAKLIYFQILDGCRH